MTTRSRFIRANFLLVSFYLFKSESSDLSNQSDSLDILAAGVLPLAPLFGSLPIHGPSIAKYMKENL